MKIHFDPKKTGIIKNAVVTTGSFDGVHVGHQTIIRRLRKRAKDIKGESVLITFYPHPRRVLYPESQGKDLLMICSQREKIELLEKTGLDHLIIIPFTRDFSKMSSATFIEEILVKQLNAKIVIVGFNHHFGHNRQGNYEYMYQLGHKYHFEVEEIPEQDIHNETVSSTIIRKALLEGNIQRANAYLDHYYVAKGRVEKNENLSLQMGLELYNLIIDEPEKLIPPDGVYAVNVDHPGGYCKAMLMVKNWGIRNNNLSPDVRIGLHPVNPGLSIHDLDVTCNFHKKIRDGVNHQQDEGFKKQLLNDLNAIYQLIY